ncbi:MAG: response regulator [Anaerolineae bacterium]
MAVRILVVEDNELYRVILTTLLTRQGFEVVAAIGVSHACDLLKAFTPELFILDITLNDGNGLELCTALRQDARTKSIPILIYSGSDDIKTRQQSLQVGADVFISKSDPHARLVGEIRSLLSGRLHTLN